MMRTHPDESPDFLSAGAFFLSASKSALRRCRLERGFSGVWALELAPLRALRAVMLASRILGTRVCNLCSKFFTLARISETICTPRLFAATVEVTELASETLRWTVIGRGVVGSLEGE